MILSNKKSIVSCNSLILTLPQFGPYGVCIINEIQSVPLDPSQHQCTVRGGGGDERIR